MDPTAKQQIVERVKQANNVLVTVSTNPSVDQLAACIGLTLLLNKIEKHGTAVFSGSVPSTLEFLQPEKTLEPTTDSLRDFIISLDKSKADKLRYKVEDEVVRIFITPYRSSISEKDLVFSQGDFNVDVVIALGVTNRDQIDAAITAHGRILHDATVISLNRGDITSDVGQINWNEPSASSLSEMIVSVSEAFGSNLLDGQMATAFLTGIVAETDRFSNQKTSPKVMTMSAQLMAAGANQQLIASKLNPPPAEILAKDMQNPPTSGDADQHPNEHKAPDGQLSIEHDSNDTDKHEESESAGQRADESQIHIDDKGLLKTTDEMHEEQEKEKLDAQPNMQEPARTWLTPGGQPSRNGTLSANTKPEEYQEAINPLADKQPETEQSRPTMTHDAPKTNPKDNHVNEHNDVDQQQKQEEHHNEPSTERHDEPASEPEHHAEFTPEPEQHDEPVEPQPEPYQPPEPTTEPHPEPVKDDSEHHDVPTEHSNETLSELQQESHHDDEPSLEELQNEPGSLDSARDAVSRARTNMPPDNTPLANLNALPLGDPLHQDTPVPLSYNPEQNGHELQLPNPDGAPSPSADSADAPPSAPPVPPPLPSMPPYMNPSSSSNSASLPPPQAPTGI